ncbi:MAG: FkbM family methyltransferase [Ilumatobacteraceae bacterium]
MRIALVSPVDPTLAGNGAALRAGFWRRTLSSFGDLTTIVVPVISDSRPMGTADAFGELHEVQPIELSHHRHPRLARRAPEWLGARCSPELDPFDLIVAFRSYMAPFAWGLSSATGAPVVVDLDDDDVDFHTSIGDLDEAERHRLLLDEIRERAAALVSATGFDDTIAVANVAALSVVETRHATGENEAPHVVMVANMGYHPNAEGARWFEEEVWPAVRDAVPSARLTIAGPGSDAFGHGIGFVGDLAELYDSADVAVAPILHGSGTRIKILDAWARQVPVVSTSLGIAGLGAVDGEHAAIEDRAGSFARAVVRLLRDRDAAARLSAGAADHLAEHFAEQRIAERALHVLRRVTDPPVGPLRRHGPLATETADGVVVDDAELGVVHHLDPVSSIVYSLCDGRSTSTTIVELVADLLSIDLDASRRRYTIALDQLVDARLVTDDPRHERLELPGSSRRIRVRPDTIDAAVALDVYSGREYDVPDTLPSGSIGIDVGAHLGAFTARLVDSGAAHVIALEPQPDNHRLATMNLAREIERGTVVLHRAAISGPPAGQSLIVGAAPLHRPVGGVPVVNTGGHRCRPGDSDVDHDAGEAVVTSQTLDDIVAGIRRDVSVDAPIRLKLDCEGGEWTTLETATCLAEISTIDAEMHLRADGSRARLDAAVARLEAAGFEVFVRSDESSVDYPRLSARRR